MKTCGNNVVQIYSGAYGLTMRFGVPCYGNLRILMGLMERMASPDQNKMQLSACAGFALNGVQSILLEAVSVEGDPSVSLYGDGRFVRWAGSRQYWQECYYLLEGFDEETPAHQYLSKSGGAGILIEVSYLGG